MIKTLNASFPLVLPVGILGKPPFLHPFTLLKNLTNAPERRKGKHSQKYRNYKIIHQQRGNTGSDTQQKEYPPAFNTNVILRLNDKRMKKPYYKKCSNSYRYS